MNFKKGVRDNLDKDFERGRAEVCKPLMGVGGACLSLISALRRKKKKKKVGGVGGDLFEFEANLIHIAPGQPGLHSNTLF